MTTERKTIAELNQERARRRQENLRKVKVGPPIRQKQKQEEEEAVAEAKENVNKRISLNE